MKVRYAVLAIATGLMIGVAFAGTAAYLLISDRANDASSTVDGKSESTPADATGALPVYWSVPAFDYVDQDHRHVTNQSLLGHPWIADFIFTRCTTACPVLTARMMLLQRQINSGDVKFISFSVDPPFDSPEVLKKYAADWHGDEKRWRLLSTVDDATVHATAAGMHVAVQHSDDPRNPILHTNRFILVDGNGQVRGLYDSTDEQAVAQLVTDLHSLEPATPGTMHTTLTDGKELFAAVGCLACHSRTAIAPPLEGIADTKVKLEGGGEVLADAAFLRESITDPAAKITAGYMPTMPSYRGQLDDTQIDALVGYLQTLKGTSTAPLPAGTGALATDPVCHMKVHIDPGTPRMEVGGKTYYFCSERCKDRFATNPELFIHAATMPATME